MSPVADDTRPVALVTGGSGALGAAIALRLATTCAGAVVVQFRRNLERAHQVVEAIEAAGGTGCVCKADVRSTTDAAALVDRVVEQCGSIDILVNGIGITNDSLLATMQDAAIEDVLTTNLMTAFWVTRAVAEHMIPNHRGTIINISSIAASHPNKGHSNYAASKAGLEGFTRALAIELGPKGIRVNAVAPGIIVSDMTEQIRRRSGEQLLRIIPLRRFGLPTDVASAVCFLASAEASYITGATIHVDGGARYGRGTT
jgi:3-oxoacyl-[acyl-carrier protein] reductase